MNSLPADSTLLPLSDGALLVSPGHATFAPVPEAEQNALHQVLHHTAPLSTLSSTLLDSLSAHGWFAPPRPQRGFSQTVHLQLTNACNLRCTYCCTNSGPPRPDELDERAFEAILVDIRTHLAPTTQVSFLGGEPFLVPFAVSLARRAIELQLPLTIFSNGLPLHENDSLLGEVAALTAQGMSLRISLAGPTRPLCDAVSGGDRFDAVVSVLHRLYDLGGTAIVDLLLMPQTAADTAATLRPLRRQLPPGCPIHIGLLYHSGRERGEHLFPSFTLQDHTLTNIAFEAGQIIPSAPPSPLLFRREACDCALGRNLNVRSDGQLFHCFKMEEPIGHIRNRTVSDTITHLRSHPHRAEKLRTCRECPLRTLCGGGCRSDNFLHTGTEEPFCPPWRLRVLCELLAEDRVSAVQWPLHHLHAEALHRGIDAPDALPPFRMSRHLVDV